MVIIASTSTIVTILIRNRVMIQLGVTMVQLFLKVLFALVSEKFQKIVTDTLSDRKKDFIAFVQTGHRELLMRLLKVAMMSTRTVDLQNCFF